jgi:hypothetical protein
MGEVNVSFSQFSPECPDSRSDKFEPHTFLETH